VTSEGLVTVIVPLGPPRRITLLTLNSILIDPYPFKEIIIVGNKKYREGYKEISNYCKKIEVLFTINGTERSEQKNYGVKISHGKYLLFIDDDMFIQSGLISECVKLITTEKVDAIAIPQKILPIGFLGRIKYMGSIIKKGHEPIEAPRFIKREVFLRLGGYDPALVYGEDADFMIRFKENGYKYTHTDRKILYLGDDNLIQYLRKYFYYGINAKKYVRKWMHKPEGRMHLWKHLFPLNKSYFSNIFHVDINIEILSTLINFIILKLLENIVFLIGLFLGG